MGVLRRITPMVQRLLPLHPRRFNLHPTQPAPIVPAPTVPDPVPPRGPPLQAPPEVLNPPVNPTPDVPVPVIGDGSTTGPGPTNPGPALPTVPTGPITQLPSDELPVVTTPGGPVMNPVDTNPDVSNPGTGPSPITSPLDPNAAKALEDKRALERAKAILEQGEQFGRRIGDEFYKEGSLGRIAEVITPGEQAALDYQKQLAETAGLQSPEARAILSQQQDMLNEARMYSPIEQEAMAAARQGLLGIDAPAIQAMRSQGKEQINREVMGQARELARAQARGQVFGASATAQNKLLGQDAVRAGRGLERDLIVANIDATQKARDSFANLTTNTEASRAGRTNNASQNFTNATFADEDARRKAKLDATSSLGNLSTSLGDRTRQLKQFNLDQAAAEKAGQIGSIFGGMGTVTDQRGLFAGEEYAKLQFEEQKRISDKMIELFNQSLKSQKATT